MRWRIPLLPCDVTGASKKGWRHRRGAIEHELAELKALLDSFSFALRHEIKDGNVTVTCLMPGATETECFARADMLDTKVGTDKKDGAADVARQGFEAMKKGEGEIATGWMNKMQAAIARIAPSDATADMHGKMAAPGTAQH